MSEDSPETAEGRAWHKWCNGCSYIARNIGVAQVDTDLLMAAVERTAIRVLMRCEELAARAEQDVVQTNVRQDKLEEAKRCSADDLRADGWSVAVHNDYTLDGKAHTFWLFTKGPLALKGEGRTDAEALDKVRTQATSVRESAKRNQMGGRP
jgi:hypothetical protein